MNTSQWLSLGVLSCSVTNGVLDAPNEKFCIVFFLFLVAVNITFEFLLWAVCV